MGESRQVILQKHGVINYFQIAAYSIIAIGIVLRLAKYLPGWSLWADEISVALNLINRSMVSLMTQPMDYEQAAPIGFLALEKILMFIFGRSEYVLRLVPVTAGIASLFLFHRLLTRTLNQYASLFTLAALSLGNYLIYYSAELKQYSSDVFISIVMCLLFLDHIQKENPGARDFWVLGLSGAAALIFSHPAVFLLAAMGITLALHHLRSRENLLKTLLMGSLWAGTFAILYFMLLRKQVTSEYLIVFWGNLLSYMPMPPWRDPLWFIAALGGLYIVVGGLSGSLYIILGLSLLGAWSFNKAKRWQWVVFVASTVGLNMVVSGFQKFPFHGRLILYLLPLVFFMLGRGIHALTELQNKPVINIGILAIASIIMLNPAMQTFESYLVTRNYVRSDIKSVFSFIRENKQPGDALYQYYRMGRLLEYYAADYGLDELPVYNGGKYNDRAKLYDEEISSLPRGQRIWFVFTFVGQTKIDRKTKMDERVYILNLLHESGTLLTEYYGTNDATSAHLFILK